MKSQKNRKSSLYFIILVYLVIFNINFFLGLKIKKYQLKIFKNDTIKETINNYNNNTQLIQDFPIKIEINWNSIKDNLNLHLKKVEKGRQLNDYVNSGSHRINNETLIKSQIMMLEKLVSGVYILFAEKFDSLKSFNNSNPSVSIFSDKKSYYNITFDRNISENLNWDKPVFWEIGKFEFSRNSIVFETFNFLTNEIIETYKKIKAK